MTPSVFGNTCLAIDAGRGSLCTLMYIYGIILSCSCFFRRKLSTYADHVLTIRWLSWWKYVLGEFCYIFFASQPQIITPPPSYFSKSTRQTIGIYCFGTEYFDYLLVYPLLLPTHSFTHINLVSLYVTYLIVIPPLPLWGIKPVFQIRFL